MKPLVLWGATGQARVLAEFAERIGYAVAALFDNDPAAASPLSGVPVYHGADGLRRWRAEHPEPAWFLAAIGGQRGRDRLEVHGLLREAGLQPATAVHPSAFVAGDARIGPGSQVLALAAVCAGARLGEACIVNTRAGVDHECVLGDGVHVAPGATLAGLVRVGDGAMIGTGATILPRIRIGADAVVGAGAVVTRDVPPGAVVYGNPARPRGGLS